MPPPFHDGIGPGYRRPAALLQASLGWATCCMLVAMLRTTAGGLQALLPVTPEPVTLSQANHLSRIHALLGSGSLRDKTPIRILIYGGEVIKIPWSDRLMQALQKRHPNCTLITTNLAVTGYQGSELLKLANADIYPFYPDLVLLHAYGGGEPYRRLIREIRERTTADVLVLTDHPHVHPLVSLDEEISPAILEQRAAERPFPEQYWGPWLNYCLLPRFADEADACLATIRDGWKRHIRTHQLAISNLVSDNYVMPNEQGQHLMIELLLPYFRPVSGMTREDPWNSARVTTYSGEDELNWKRGKVRIEFTGNRVEVITDAASDEPVSVLLDGKPPSEHPSLYGVTRCSLIPGSDWPALLNSQSAMPLQEEEWTASLNNVHSNRTYFTFKLAGSKTGPDGEGRSDREFRSRSGRVLIAPDDWEIMRFAAQNRRPVPESLEVRWKTVFRGRDEYKPTVSSTPGEFITTVLATGLPNQPHVLELTTPSGRPSPIRAIRCYRPPLIPPSVSGKKRIPK
ncbi:MAG: hypothetical protein EXS36_09480 [Pedosphaera sp.]|nr:hypothetical protein [Pedosphaera sp.]